MTDLANVTALAANRLGISRHNSGAVLIGN
jgi:hypothetical protein